MSRTGKRIEPPTPAIRLHIALHIGAGSVSMLIAERLDDGSLRTLDFLEKPASLAKDIFRHEHVTHETVERIISIIRGYQEILAELHLSPEAITRAVITNILGEARNQESIINRIRIACGIDVSPIDDGEMTRLIYLKTRRRLQNLPAMRKGNTLVIHVGPGNTRVLLFQDGLITRYTSYRMGTYRTREAVEASHSEGATLQRVIREHTSGNLVQIRVDYQDIHIDGVVMIGYEIQSVRKLPTSRESGCSIRDFRRFNQLTASATALDLVKRHQIDYHTAEVLLPALEINLAIAEALGMERVHIPDSFYEQGLLHDILVSRDLTDTFAEEVLRSARILAAKYHCDPSHGEHVGNICQHFFQKLQDLHQLDAHDHLLLQVSAILHEVGTYVSPRAHHKHSEYLILNSEIFGLDRLDVTIVALVARYHRHSGPVMQHALYASLPVAARIRVCKLAAILRVADALERTHAQRVSTIDIVRDRDKLRLRLPGISDAAVERLAMDSKADLFEQVFGLTVTIDED